MTFELPVESYKSSSRRQIYNGEVFYNVYTTLIYQGSLITLLTRKPLYSVQK